MRFEVILTHEARKELYSLDFQYQQIVKDDYNYIQEYSIDDVITKNIRNEIFEIKSGRVRSLFGFKEGKQVIVAVIFLKKNTENTRKIH